MMVWYDPLEEIIFLFFFFFFGQGHLPASGDKQSSNY